MELITFLEELKELLPESTGAQRKEWAAQVVENDWEVRNLVSLLECEYKIASRFLWLLSDIGEADPKRLKVDLPYLFERISTAEIKGWEASFANYWIICGVPEAKEGTYLDQLFTWLNAPELNVTTKSRALVVLHELSLKYPEIRNELRSAITEQIPLHTSDFRKKAEKMLSKLETM